MDLYLVKQEFDGLVEKIKGLAEIEKMRVEEELRFSRMECEELKKKLKCVAESKEIEKMKFEEELKSSQMECEEMKRKIIFVEESKDSEILMLRNKLFAADQELDKLRQENKEAARFAEDFKFRKMEAEEFLEKTVVDLKMTIRSLEAKVDDLRLPDLECGKDGEYVVIKSPVVGTNCGSAGLVKRVHASKTVQNSQGAPSDHNEIENTKREEGQKANFEHSRRKKSGAWADFDTPRIELKENDQENEIKGLGGSDLDDEPINKPKTTESKENQTPKRKRIPSGSESDDDIPIIKSLMPAVRQENRFKRALNDDDEFCMNAVCALYRQQIYAAKSKSPCGSNLSKIGGFSHFDLMSGSDLAEYLIDDDPDLKLRKSVSQVKDQRPEVLDECRKLATAYHENLYTIFRNRKDTFFRQTQP